MTALRPASVYYFGTCLADLFFPSAGLAGIKLLQAQGIEVIFPQAQSCCGQPAYSAGRTEEARAVARAQLGLFPKDIPIVVPSGSCGGMIKRHYLELFADEPALYQRAQHLAKRTYELVSFLTDVLGLERVAARYEGVVTYHDSCSGLRELGVAAQPRKLLASVDGLELVEMEECETCCGFGGTFAVKFGEISTAIVERKVENIENCGAPVVLAGDLGCLMNMAGKLARNGSPIELRHFAEVLAGMTDAPAICAAATPQSKR